MTEKSEHRRAHRLHVVIPTMVESIPAVDVPMHPELAKVYERVMPASEKIGESIPFVMRDLSTNGAFLEGPPLPLLSRVRFTFDFEGYGKVNAIGWTLWRRMAACRIPVEGKDPVDLPSGVGVLFEAVELNARLEIATRCLF